MKLTPTIPQDEESEPLKLGEVLPEVLHDVDARSVHEDTLADEKHDCETDSEHDSESDTESDVEANTKAETHDTESDTEIRNTLQDRLEPVEQDEEGDILEHEVLPDMD